MKKFIAFMLTFMLALVFIGCGETDVKPTKITVTATESTVVVNQTLTLKANVEPADASDKSVTWTSSDDAIAVVNASGVVKGNAVGTVTITATSKADETIKGTIEIKVEAAEEVLPTAMSVWGNSNTVVIGYDAEFFITFTPSNTTAKDVTWESSDETIATVDENGVVKGVKAGTCKIIAKSTAASGVIGEREITVKDAIDITDLEIAFDEENMVIGHEFKITATTTPAGGAQQLEWSTSDETVATVDANGKVTPVAPGTVTITVKVMNKNIERELTISVINPPALVDFVISGVRSITTNEFLTLGVTTTPKYAETNIEWSVDKTNIATIDAATGKLTPVTTGEVTVTAKDTKANITKTCVVTINEPFDANAKPTSVTIYGDSEMYAGYSMQLTAQVFPAGVSQKVIWESSNEAIATVDENGRVTALATGTVRIKAKSAIAPEISSTNFKIEITQEPEPPAIPNLGGYKIVIMNADSALAEIDPFLEGYSSADKAYKQRAWTEVENEFNCEISVEAYPDSAPWGSQRVKWITDNASAGTSLLDFGVISAAWLYQFVQANAAVDTSDFFKLYGKKQIEAAQKDAGTYKNKMYIVSTGLSQTTTYPYKGLFYNYGMLKSLGLESPAKLFNEGKWSYDEFVQYCIEAQAALPEGKYVMSGGPSIVWAGMVNAAGIKIADKATVELNLTHEYSLEAVAALTKVVEAGAWAIDEIGYDQDCQPFQRGDALFQPGDYWFVRAANRFPAELWGEGTAYGYVPFPYPSTVGKENTMVNTVGSSVMMMVAGRTYPAGVDAGGIYYALQTVFLNTIKYQEEDPSFDPYSLKVQATKSRIDDPESIDATIYFTAALTLYDPLFEGSFQYDYSGDTTKAVINSVKGADPREEFDAIYSAVDLAFKNIYNQ